MIRKSIACIVFMLVSIMVFAQTPEKFNYQAVIRNAEGEVVQSQNVSIKLSILDASTSGTAVFSESHSVTTNNYGLVTLTVGTGTKIVGTIADVDWSTNNKYLKVEVDRNGGDSFTDLGVVQLASVPYALYAKNVMNADDADADTTNELQSLSLNGNTLSISNGNEVTLSSAGSVWFQNQETVYYNDGNVGIGTETPFSKLEVKADPSANVNEPLFEVINANNDTVFAVYPDGVKIFVDSEAKGKVGGFAVSGRTAGKANGVENYLTISPDSARIYFNEDTTSKGKVGGFAVSGRTPGKSIANDILVANLDNTHIYVGQDTTTKGKVGGFAVSGRTPGKGIVEDYLVINEDSTRIYVNDSVSSKGKVGGFAVSGRTAGKGITNNYLEINKDSTRIYVNDDIGSKGKVGGFAVSGRTAGKLAPTDYFNITPTTAAEEIVNESRIMWYPAKSALLAGEIYVPDPDSVGEFSMSLGYRNFAIGNWSQAMGQLSIARGNYSTAIGFEAEANGNSFAFGTGSKALGFNSFAFGSVGLDSLGAPSTSYTTATGDYSFAFGLGSGAEGTGSFVLGTECYAYGDFSIAAGFKTEAIGFGATAMGGRNIAEGAYSLAFGNSNHANGLASVAFGTGNSAEGTQILVAGFGNIVSGQGAIAFGISNTVNGDGAFASGTANQSTNVYATAFGSNNIASNTYSFAMGNTTESTGVGSFSMGFDTEANGDQSFAGGISSTTASTATAAFAMGSTNAANGDFSTALGYNTTANSWGATVIGAYNATTGAWPDNWMPISSEPQFVVGIGTSSSSKDAFVVYKDGSAKINGSFYPQSDDSFDLGKATTNRWRDIYTNGAVTTTSDFRAKFNIIELTYGLKEIMKLRPVSYLWKNNPDRGLRLGLIAQEVQPVINEVVHVGNDDEHTMGLRYSELIPVLIKSIQEQQDIIDQEKAKNEALQNQIDDILKRLEQLEQK